MREDLKAYFDYELAQLKFLGHQFALQNSREAANLQLEEHGSADPHVQRLLESFAFLAARIHLKLDDGFPQITEALLQVLYPHYLAPVPSMAIAQFELDPTKGKVSAGYRLDAGTRLSWSVREEQVTFRTGYPITLWPIEVKAAHVERLARDGRSGVTPSALVLRIATHPEASFDELEMSSLRFHLDGPAELVHQLYESLLGHCTSVLLRRPGQAGDAVALGQVVSAVGFGKDEGLLPYSSRSHLGYRLVQEYFAFPAKFLFFDVAGLALLRNGTFTREAELVFVLDRPFVPSQAIGPEHFKLGCGPIVNLFSMTADVIDLDYARTEYEVIPEKGRVDSIEVYSVDRVTGQTPGEPDREFHPFYSFRHSYGAEPPSAFWHATRRKATRKNLDTTNVAGTDVLLTLVDRNFSPSTADRQQLVVGVTCTNRDLPGRRSSPMPAGIEVAGAGEIKSATCLAKPTAAMWPKSGHDTQWQLISHLSLNYLSLVEPDEHGAPEALRAILGLYDFSDKRDVQEQIQAITRIATEAIFSRIEPQKGTSGFARGVRATIEFDEPRLLGAGAGIFLLSSVLEKFLALCVSVNSLSELVATSHGEVVKRWPPRSGFQPLL